MRPMTRMGLILAMLAASLPAAGARSGGHGHGGMHMRHMHGDGAGTFASDKRHGDDPYTKAASEEEDRLLNTRLKSICRGC
ncbi:hypothetical protein JQ615_18520 [Bradyrhizobium jicamae]|uniref:Uncharacterized protein n=1 Tax=Bradyrhizobium jicamae TaxID=280332 RepID=A0ABS5FLY4_9BRAD|nr:hypothetical protein [Bradyrhizobium jicamae]MBR0797386.1 hypothetical protein [Bradyrhizobium jicamae]MBR0936226.1 hypothetical protein [Bradyrhizobium jicamae]